MLNDLAVFVIGCMFYSDRLDPDERWRRVMAAGGK
jgi:hypothetical protein